MFKFIEKSKNKLIDFYNTFLCVLQNSLTNETNFNIFVIRKQSIPPYSSILLNSDWPPKLTLSLLWLLMIIMSFCGGEDLLVVNHRAMK